MFGRLNTILRGDRGESSITLIISQFVSLIVAAALAGLVFVLVTGGARIQSENAAQTELQIANRAFTTDVDNAARIFITDESKLTLSSTKFLKNTAGAFVCRSSSWYFAPASAEIEKERGNTALYSLYNDITVYATADCSSAVTSTQSRVAVAAVKEDSAAFHYTNVAGVTLQFSNGIATNFRNVVFDTVTNTYNQIAAAQFRTDNAVDSWYTDSEMYRDMPKVIEARMVAVFPVTANNPATFKATTNEAETELVGNNTGVIDPGGEQTRWVPNPVSDIWVKRSTNTGAYVGGAREGINISWAARPRGECSPAQTIKYVWLVTNIRTNHQSSGETSGDTISVDVMTNQGGNAEIWNGGNYKIQVAARCNDVDGQSLDKAANYTLPIPTVVNVGVTANGSQANHTVSYAQASTDPTVRYTIQYSPANVARAGDYTRDAITLLTGYEAGASNGGYATEVWRYPAMPWTNAGTSATTSFAKNGNTVVVGYPDTYQVRASTTDSPNTGGAWSPANYIYNVPAPAAPVINTSTPTGGSWTAVTCSPNTVAEYRPHFSNTVGGANTTPSTPNSAPQSGTSIAFGYTINQGSKVWVRVDARCVTKFTLTPTNNQVTTTLSPYSPSSTANWDRPIAAPAPPYNLATPSAGYGNGGNARNTWQNPTCPVGTTITIRHEIFTPAIHNIWIGNNTERNTALNQVPGTDYAWRVQARCESYASGAHMYADSSVPDQAFNTEVPAPSIYVYASSNSVWVGDTVSINTSLNVGCVSGTYLAGSSTGTSYVSQSYAGSNTWWRSNYCVSTSGNGRPSATSSDYASVTWNARPGYPGGSDLINNGTAGCGVPGNYTPQVGVAFRINASQGGCYWQSAQPVRNGLGQPIPGQFQPWDPGYPGRWFANYSG